MAIVSKVQICNLALGVLGSAENILNIDNPTNASEKIFALRYDLTRQKVLKLVKPNFALKRDKWAKLNVTPSFGYAYAYAVSNDCLAVLGIGNIEEKRNDYAVEGGQLQTNQDAPEGLPVRYVRDITDVTKFTPEFVDLLAWHLAYDCCMSLTQSAEKLGYLTQIMPHNISNASAMNAQENRPIRISNSKFKAARYNRKPSFEEKL